MPHYHALIQILPHLRIHPQTHSHLPIRFLHYPRRPSLLLLVYLAYLDNV